jgi:hypothetical protein
MKYLRGGPIAGLSVAALLMSSMPLAQAATVSAGDADGTPQLLTELQFNSTTATVSTIGRTSTTAATQALLPNSAVGVPGWAIGAQNGGSVSVQATTGPAGTPVDALEGSYPAAGAGNGGGQYGWADYSVAALQTEDIYIEFWAKMPAAKGGFKFLKVFGDRSTSTGHADLTFAADYTGVDNGAIMQAMFGDGTSLVNDGQNAIKLDGSHPNLIGRSLGTAVVKTPQMSSFSSADWGTGWHHFLVHVKFNSGTTAQNEAPNGEFFLELDGKVYVDATGLYNRNPANGPINEIELLGWAQNDPQPFQVWYDDLRISTGGFMSQGLPDPPANVALQ